ncbi:MAG: rhomboid family intramembrane serine protease [Desulfosarcinaceae bacterium]
MRAVSGQHGFRPIPKLTPTTDFRPAAEKDAVPMTCVARRLSNRRVNELIPIFSALEIPHHFEPSGRKMNLWVTTPHAPFVRRQLARLKAQDRENSALLFSESPLAAAWSSVVVAVGLALLHLLISIEGQSVLFYESFGAVDKLIRGGEYYRCVTALLLHSSLAHLLGNLAALMLFGPFVCRRFGHGWGWLLILLSGVGGNYINAWIRGAPHLVMGPHLSVGASTAVFGAVGMLVAVNSRRRATEKLRWRRWTPVAGGLGFLAFMGSAPGSDLLAHLFGFFVGLGIGAIADTWLSPPVRGRYQALSAGAALAIVFWAWSRGLPSP